MLHIWVFLTAKKLSVSTSFFFNAIAKKIERDRSIQFLHEKHYNTRIVTQETEKKHGCYKYNRELTFKIKTLYLWNDYSFPMLSKRKSM